MIHSFNKQIKFTSQGYNNETLPSVWPQSEGGNTDTVYCCQWKFTLLFCLPLRASLRHKGYFVWHLAIIVIIIYLFLPCLFFSSRNSPASELIINRVHEWAPGSGRWATDKGYTKLECVHLRVNDSGLITAACCRGKGGRLASLFVWHLCVWHPNYTLLSCIVCCLFQGLDNWRLWIYVACTVDSSLWSFSTLGTVGFLAPY